MKLHLRDANVVTCETADAPAFRGDVLVQDGRIAAVSPTPLQVDSARVVDCGGATVLPALADAHVHISWPLDFVFDHGALVAADPAEHALDVAATARTFLESGYTLVIGAGVSQPWDDLRTKAFIDKGWLPGPRIVPSGGMVTQPGAIGAEARTMDVVADAREVREAVAKQCDAGVKAVKFFLSGDGIVPEFPSEDCYMNDEMVSAAVDEAAKYGAFLTAHARGALSVAMAARCGVKIIHHACFLDDLAMKELQARGDDVFVCPGMHYLHQMVHGAAEPYGMDAGKLERSGYAHELESLVEGISTIHRAGVNILSGGDFGHQWTHHGTYAAELQRFVEDLGMSTGAALQTATKNAGAATGLDWGVLREGALADLIVLDGDPLADITVLQDHSRFRVVVKDGAVAWANPVRYP